MNLGLSMGLSLLRVPADTKSGPSLSLRVRFSGFSEAPFLRFVASSLGLRTSALRTDSLKGMSLSGSCLGSVHSSVEEEVRLGSEAHGEIK